MGLPGVGKLRVRLTILRQAMCCLVPLIVLSGCYTFRPVELDAVRPGMAVRLEVQGVDDRSRAPLGPQQIEGRLIRLEADSLKVAVWQAPRVGGVRDVIAAGEIERAIDVRRVTGLEEKRLSPVRTGGLIVGVGVLASVVARILWQSAGGFLSGGDSGGNGL